MIATTTTDGRPTQAARRERTRNALLKSASRRISRYGYGNLVLERVAAEAGYSRGALYHLFGDKKGLALAVVAWAGDNWQQEVGQLADQEADPVDALIALGRAHAVYCRGDEAGVIMTLKVEFGDRDHPVGRAVEQTVGTLIEPCARLIAAGRLRGSIPPGPSARTLARAFLGAIEGAVAQLGGRARDDQLVAERVIRGVLGLDNSR
jgi:AcrR family transcriptional regulator